MSIHGTRVSEEIEAEKQEKMLKETKGKLSTVVGRGRRSRVSGWPGLHSKTLDKTRLIVSKVTLKH
ncbi:hypothetical protein I79_003724 [Cricetulus griseus]|uniref:Uncharacterized protein n=1 Tax=Cricetulus griseus TaxID=10029 RepID=G3H0R0_CRIGR|nr:hypothetical protein I79_003724 [Cricetulus griseus]